MLIIPVEHAPSRKHLPWVTFFLIALNTLIFFAYQADDPARWARAKEAYVSGKLSERERPLYVKYVEATPAKTPHWISEEGEPDNPQKLSDQMLAMRVLPDLEFDAYVHGSDIYRQDAAWQTARSAFEAARGQISIYRFGFIPGKPTWQGLIGASFLHGDPGHLIGNMIFLFVFGFALEIVLGARRYLALYVAGGVLSTAFWWVLSSELAPGVGASGAIAALMGMYLAVYGLRRIRFFYWIAIFFGFFTAPAILMLPIWVAKELWGLLLEGGRINYTVHIGGLLSGYAMVAGGRLLRWIPLNEDYLYKKDPEAALKKGLFELERLIGLLETERAGAKAMALLKAYPADLRILELLFALLKSQPEASLTVMLVKQLWKVPRTLASEVLWRQLAEDAVQGGQILRDPRLQLVLLERLIEWGMVDPALALWRQLVAHRQPLQQWPKLSLMLGKMLGRDRNFNAVNEITASLCKTYPRSEEARLLYQYRQHLRG